MHHNHTSCLTRTVIKHWFSIALSPFWILNQEYSPHSPKTLNIAYHHHHVLVFKRWFPHHHHHHHVLVFKRRSLFLTLESVAWRGLKVITKKSLAKIDFAVRFMAPMFSPASFYLQPPKTASIKTFGSNPLLLFSSNTYISEMNLNCKMSLAPTHHKLGMEVGPNPDRMDSDIENPKPINEIL